MEPVPGERDDAVFHFRRTLAFYPWVPGVSRESSAHEACSKRAGPICLTGRTFVPAADLRAPFLWLFLWVYFMVQPIWPT
jgi:hypothetical protein